MKNIIDEISFKMKEGREVCVSEYGGGWTQYGVRTPLMLAPQFLDELWQLLHKWHMIETDY